MKIKTTRFGEIDVSQELIFDFTHPLLGYEDELTFVLIEHKDNSNFRWLQSTKSPELAFVVTMPGFFGIDYTFELPEQIQDDLDIQDADDLLAFNIVVIPHENPSNATINLLAPLVFNIKNKKAGQIVLSGSNNFEVDYPLLKREGVC